MLSHITDPYEGIITHYSDPYVLATISGDDSQGSNTEPLPLRRHEIALPIGSIVVPFGDYLIGFYI